MNGSQHTDLTERVAFAVLNDAALATRVASTATFPDDVDDIRVEGVRTHIVGKTFCSVEHFFDGKEHGYCWKRDTSVPHVDLPNRRVACLHERWSPVFMPTNGHPLLGHEGMADEMEFQSSFSMARWIEPFCEGRPKSSARALGCALHLVQDCTKHHARLWMLRGHALHEAVLQERWFSGAFRPYRDRIIAGAVKQRRILSPSESVRLACLGAASDKPSAGAIDATIMRAVRYTAATLRWWRR